MIDCICKKVVLVLAIYDERADVMFRYGGKARGVTLVELLTAIPLSLLILTAVLQLFFLAVRTFERNEDMSAAPGWDAAEKFLAFLGTP